jgi:hypothetical protein
MFASSFNVTSILFYTRSKESIKTVLVLIDRLCHHLTDVLGEAILVCIRGADGQPGNGRLPPLNCSVVLN